MDNKVQKINRGSEWRKWDLHIHSLYTNLENNYSNVSVLDFVKKISDVNISVVGLTNYFNFSANDFILKSEIEKKNIVVFLNLEIRLAYQNKEDDCCDAHILFDTSITKNEIENFLTKLNVTYKGSEKIAKNLNSKGEFSGSTVEFDHLIKTLEQESLGLSSKYLIGFLSRGKGNSRSSANYEKIAKKSHFLIHSSDKVKNLDEDKNFWLTKNKPLLQSSDAHKLDTIGSKFTWIKADPTFMGLEQIIYEPEDRVKIQELKPEDKSEHFLIDRIEYKVRDASKQIVYLNQNLNSIIGSRATGKSNLLRNIAYSVDPKQCELRGVTSGSFLPLNSFKVFWKDGKESDLSSKEDNEKGILFIPQRYLGELVYDDDPRFDKFLVNLFENNDNFKKATESYRKFEDANILKINSLTRDLLATRSVGLEKHEKLKKLGKKEDQEKEIIDLESKILVLGKTSSVTKIELKKHSTLSAQIVQQNKEVKIIEQDIESFRKLKDEKIISSERVFELQFSKISFDKIKEKLEESDDIFKKDFIDREIKLLTELKQKTSETISGLEKEIKPLQDKVNQSKALIELTELLGKKKDVKTQIENLVKEIGDLKNIYESKKKEIVEAYLQFEEQYRDLRADFGDLKFSQVKFVLEFDTKSLCKMVEDSINYHNSIDFKKDENIKYKNVKNFLSAPNNFVYNQNEFSLILKELLDVLLSAKLLLKSGKDIETVISELFKNRYKINFLKSVVSKSDVEFPEMSDGEQMLALLEFIFKFDDYNYPILLDQPEDDLDSRAISTTIVNFIKLEKIKRQIIIASHNANLVVCGDSENVLISKKKGGKNPEFEYSSGAIENSFINKEIVEILEGGKDALHKRMKKLNIK